MTQQVATQTRYISCADTAKLIRQALKESFPGIKFSVRSSSYSGGAHVSVKWVDGPTSKAVEAVCRRYEGASFDGMQDLKSYHEGELNGEKAHFGNDWTSCNRVTSIAFVTAVAKAYCERYHEAMPMIALSGDCAYIADRNFSEYHHYTNEIYRKIEETDAAHLDRLFEQEDREIAEYEARLAERQAAEVAPIVEEEMPVASLEEATDHAVQTAYSGVNTRYIIPMDALLAAATEVVTFTPEQMARVHLKLSKEGNEVSIRWLKKYGHEVTVGYFNWCDRVCYQCVKTHGNLNVSTWEPLTLADAIKDNGYTCDYCTKEFPEGLS